MPHKLRMVEPIDIPGKVGVVNIDSKIGYQIGDCWYQDLPEDFKSPEYKRDWEGKRKPLWVCLPPNPGWPFCVDQKSTDHPEGWTVTGEAPNITVKPSINAVGVYHGWITDGVISDG